MSFQPEKSTFCLNLIQNCSAGSQGNFWFICSSLPLQLCHIRLWNKITFIWQWIQRKMSMFWDRDPLFFVDVVLFLHLLSLCYTSPHLLYCFLSYWSLSQLVQVQHRQKRRVQTQPGACVLFPPVCNESTALWCYQIILFQKLLIKTWVIRQVTKDFLFIFLDNTK